MSLLNRARKAAAQRESEVESRRLERDRYNRGLIASAVNNILDLENQERLEAGDIRIVAAEWDRPLGAFALAGLDFIAGSYWHGNPSTGFLLAVKVSPRAKIAWPPPHPRSAQNSSWAPRGYKAINTVADLAPFADAASASDRRDGQ